MGFDQLEALVRKRRGVHSYLSSHRPGWMFERVLDRDVLELGPRAAAERATGCRKDERLHGGRIAPLEALKDGRVLAVDREQEPAAQAVCSERELACGDEALLVGEREGDALLERPERRLYAGEADDGIEHHVRARGLKQVDCGAADLRVLDIVGRRNLGEWLPRRHHRAELELGVELDDLDRLTADRARGAEEGNALHDVRLPDSVLRLR